MHTPNEHSEASAFVKVQCIDLWAHINHFSLLPGWCLWECVCQNFAIPDKNLDAVHREYTVFLRLGGHLFQNELAGLWTGKDTLRVGRLEHYRW